MGCGGIGDRRVRSLVLRRRARCELLHDERLYSVVSCARADLDGLHRSRPAQVRHALAAANQGHLDLQAHEEHPRAIQLLLGHTKLESTIRYLGIEVDDALEISEQTEI
jgi:hypothetical protein